MPTFYIGMTENPLALTSVEDELGFPKP